MPPRSDVGIVTVAALRERDDDQIECLFNEREQIFRLPLGKQGAALAERLETARQQGRPVKATVNPSRARLQALKDLDDRELRAFQKTRELLEGPARPRAVNTKAIDPTRFNVVGVGQRWPGFDFCSRVVPNYKVAQDIFEFCAAQTCSLGGPFAINPCIPFQYVIDGCYARAHKMRQVIETRYGYCCEKVFSFANQGNDSLAVQATKWGGCCVTWWFHVAPLLRVRVRLQLGPINLQLVLALVIDPGMFDKPVLLSSWLGAQQQQACDPNAHVSMYSIQTGSAYMPANYAGTAFTTDPNYSQTDATLTDYAGLVTC